MQPVTIPLPFSAISAPSCLRASSYPSARSRVMIRSESTSALGQPREVKDMRGALSMGSPGTLHLQLFGVAFQVIGLIEKFNRNTAGASWRTLLESKSAARMVERHQLSCQNQRCPVRVCYRVVTC